LKAPWNNAPVILKIFTRGAQENALLVPGMHLHLSPCASSFETRERARREAEKVPPLFSLELFPLGVISKVGRTHCTASRTAHKQKVDYGVQ
jgi:hypothetical protein